ncbi:hypothetical protein BpHYR1_051626 [Brachionus plicatilis]|uniref:Uncharacterized protein n=1 Tax=Brachionus plicatilis TaxID=10195 RepID=A0A3M7R0B3_BRAPC|nr:hypothetical protein BpHYR1_051626 [Brachionus plicatilis]
MEERKKIIFTCFEKCVEIKAAVRMTRLLNLLCFLNKESNDIEIKRIGGHVVRSTNSLNSETTSIKTLSLRI